MIERDGNLLAEDETRVPGELEHHFAAPQAKVHVSAESFGDLDDTATDTDHAGRAHGVRTTERTDHGLLADPDREALFFDYVTLDEGGRLGREGQDRCKGREAFARLHVHGTHDTVERCNHAQVAVLGFEVAQFFVELVELQVEGLDYGPALTFQGRPPRFTLLGVEPQRFLELSALEGQRAERGLGGRLGRVGLQAGQGCRELPVQLSSVLQGGQFVQEA